MVYRVAIKVVAGLYGCFLLGILSRVSVVCSVVYSVGIEACCIGLLSQSISWIFIVVIVIVVNHSIS